LNDFSCRTRVHDRVAPDKVFSILSHRLPMSMRLKDNSGEENLGAPIVSFNERKNGAKDSSPRGHNFYFCYAAVAALRLGVGSASPSQRTLTSFETPGSCMVTP